MNKFILFFALIFTACGTTPDKPSTLKSPVAQESSPVKRDFIGGNAVHTWRVKMDNHYYVGVSVIGEDINGITHDPICPCQK